MFKVLKCALLSIGVITGILCLLIVLMRPSVSSLDARKRDCNLSLKQIGIYFRLYESRYERPLGFGRGADSWFAQVWRPDMAANGNLFRCACRGKAGSGTHYWTVVRGGSWTSGGRTFTFATAQDLLKAPPDFPIACDALVDPPNHPDGTVNVLSMDGQVRTLDAREFAKSHPDFLGPTEWVAPEGPY